MTSQGFGSEEYCPRGATVGSSVPMTDCVSCGLALPSGVLGCPGCGTSQVLAGATSEDARCSTHSEVIAIRSCARCGRFMCVACTDADSDPERPTCRSCHAPLGRELQARLERVTVKMGVGAMAQGLVVPALAWISRDRNLLVLTLWLALPAFAFGLLMAATRKQWVLAPISVFILGCISVWAVGASWLMALGVLLPFLLVRWFFVVGPVERELWRVGRGG